MKSQIFALTVFLVLTQPTFASTFNEIIDVLNDKNYFPTTAEESSEYSIYLRNLLPRYEVNNSTIFAQGTEQLRKDTKRTVNDQSDYYPRLAKLLHANGICMVGKWKATEENPYSGLFKKGTESLFIGRASVTMSGTTYSEKRGFALAGKIFPTLDPNENVKTANFFSIEVLLGLKEQYFMDTQLTNEPETGFDLSLIGLGLKIGTIFSLADQSPGFRPLYPLSETAVLENETVRTPHWFRITAQAPKIRNNEADFRNEIIETINDNNQIVFNVEVSNKGNDRKDNSLWKKVGEIEINQAIVSYGCDRRLHFPHPKVK